MTEAKNSEDVGETALSSSAPFSKQMRIRTRKIHNLSDNLVNLKLGATISNDQVWAEGLLVFYEIFRYLEKSMDKHGDSLIGDLDVEGMRRTRALEVDLEFYYGEEWDRTYEIRPAVAAYLAHLEKLEKRNPYLLIPYIYHLYMGLLSGGQVLNGKRKLFGKGKEGGDAAVTFSEERPIGVLKKELRSAVDGLANDLDAETREAILDEGTNVFKLNNTIIETVEGLNEIFYKRLAMILACLILAFIICMTLYRAL